MSDYRVDLATASLGGRVLATNDEFFAAKENLIADAEPIFVPDKYVSTGKWMDGWESRRRRDPGHDWCVVKLGLRGVIDEIVVDTAFFRGNFPEACSIEACDLGGQPSIAALIGEGTAWTEILSRSLLAGDTKNRFVIAHDRPVTHLRLRIYPDGGVARLRVFGRALPDWNRLDFGGGDVDLVAIEHGGRIVEASDDFFGHGHNMIMPHQPLDMRDGWETRRRRGPGHDWIVLALGAPGEVRRIEVDTSNFKGNAPGRCMLEVCDAGEVEAGPVQTWTQVLPEVPLQPHLRHAFADELVHGVRATHVRFHIYPDGGVARLRLWGRTIRATQVFARLAALNAMPAPDAEDALLACCGSTRWARELAAARPFPDAITLMITADRIWRSAGEADWREAFAAHPRIGERAGSAWSQGEQAGVAAADTAVLSRLAEQNQAYDDRFGFIFIVCATGKSAGEMLALLEARLHNEPATELAIAADEQRKITRLRLEKWLTQR